MITFLISIFVLLAGYIFYGAYIERTFGSDNRATPAVRLADGIDYVEIVDGEYLQPVDTIQGETLIALAVHFGKARLIDNTIIESKG